MKTTTFYFVTYYRNVGGFMGQRNDSLGPFDTRDLAAEFLEIFLTTLMSKYEGSIYYKEVKNYLKDRALGIASFSREKDNHTKILFGKAGAEFFIEEQHLNVYQSKEDFFMNRKSRSLFDKQFIIQNDIISEDVIKEKLT